MKLPNNISFRQGDFCLGFLILKPTLDVDAQIASIRIDDASSSEEEVDLHDEINNNKEYSYRYH
jgi:hypothetical protein